MNIQNAFTLNKANSIRTETSLSNEELIEESKEEENQNCSNCSSELIDTGKCDLPPEIILSETTTPIISENNESFQEFDKFTNVCNKYDFKNVIHANPKFLHPGTIQKNVPQIFTEKIKLELEPETPEFPVKKNIFIDYSPKSLFAISERRFHREKSETDLVIKRSESRVSKNSRGRKCDSYMKILGGNVAKLSDKFEFLLKSNNKTIQLMTNFNMKLNKIDEQLVRNQRRKHILW